MAGTEDILSSVGDRMHLAKTSSTVTCRPARWQWDSAYWPWESAALGVVCSCVGASGPLLLSRAHLGLLSHSSFLGLSNPNSAPATNSFPIFMDIINKMDMDMYIYNKQDGYGCGFRLHTLR